MQRFISLFHFNKLISGRGFQGHFIGGENSRWGSRGVAYLSLNASNTGERQTKEEMNSFNREEHSL